MSNNERDELAELLADTVPMFHEYADAFGEIADAILAAGYHKPRTITTAEELDALPGGAVIRDDDGDVLEAVRCTGDAKAGVPDYNCWDQIAETWPLDSDKIALPATVLDEANQ